MKIVAESTMKVDLYKAAWLLLHFIANLVEIISSLWTFVKFRCVQLWEQNYRNDIKSIKKELELARNDLEKIPGHLAIILGGEEPDFRILSNVIFWCLSIGIKHVSFYDHKGILVKESDKLQKYIASWKRESEKIIWNVNEVGVNGSQIVYQNGLMKELSVNFLSPMESKTKIAEVVQQIAATDCPPEDISIDFLNKQFKQIITSDPELAIYFGKVCCTYGFLPWHIRLTEFVGLPAQNALTLNTFLRTLYEYAKCEQRFGK